MDAHVKLALKDDKVIDITTTGRKSGQPRRLEIWFHNVDDNLYITGLPGKRDWYANLVANPQFTFHLKESTQADLAAQARPIMDTAERRTVFSKILKNLQREDQLEDWMANSPLIEVILN